MYRGICRNESCNNSTHQFMCRWCIDYLKGNPPLGRLGGGRQSGIFRNLQTARQHFKNATHRLSAQIHQPPEDILDQSTMPMDLDVSEFTSCNDDNFHEAAATPKIDFVNNCGFAEHSKSPAFYEFVHSNGVGMGAQYLTAKAFDVPVNTISLAEARFSLLMAKLLCQLTKTQHGLLAEILTFASNAKDDEKSIFKGTRLPITVGDFEYLYISGPNSILCNLPHPVPKCTEDKTHAYVTLTDVIANELAAGTSFDDFRFESSVKLEHLTEDPNTLSTTPAAYHLFFSMREEETISGGHSILYLWIKEWRDDFDPNSTKSSRNQVWINTYTICPPSNEKKGRNTYFMAMSGKGLDHSKVESIFGDEIDVLSRQGAYFYSGAINKIIKVKVGKLITCVDRPERTSMFQIGDHNGKYSTNFGYAAFIDGFCNHNHLPSCDNCRRTGLRGFFDKTLNISDTTHRVCESNSCANWNVMDSYFSFPVPPFYPTKYDKSDGAALPPLGRVVITPERNVATLERSPPQRLPTVPLTVEWLKGAIDFASHNIKTRQPRKVNGNDGAYYWTKGNFGEYLKTCGLNQKLIDEVYKSARKDPLINPIPHTWSDKYALKKCHYAAMHMLFLGHTKSNFEMTSTWLSDNGLKSSFGAQVNKYLDLIQQLRLNKYFNAHLLSPSSWGTGPWVSENYVFWARTQKFWFIMPNILNCKQMKNKDKQAEFIKDLRMIHRFASSAQAAISCIMSVARFVPNMELVIKIYMDSMVEIDRLINKSSSEKKRFNFVKSNSLGILSATECHNYLGPAILHWEGGFSGERKIQEVKPLLSIKRSNVNWEQITLRRLYQLDSMTKLLEAIPTEDDKASKTRETEGVLKVYASYTSMHAAVTSNYPISGVVDHDNKVWVACRPGGGATRSTVELHELTFDDKEGENIWHLCWMAPMELSSNATKTFLSMKEVMAYSNESVLLLPALCDDGNEYLNMYYCVGSNWTERTSTGCFEQYNINEQLFDDWTVPPSSNEDEIFMATEVTDNPTSAVPPSSNDNPTSAVPPSSNDDEIFMATEVADNPTSATLQSDHFVEE
jgi:hypothetical protein